MRKCISCGETKGLKGIMWDDPDGYTPHAICKSCYFETCSCEVDGHSVKDCLEDITCENHNLTVGLNNNWSDYNYNFKLKYGDKN